MEGAIRQPHLQRKRWPVDASRPVKRITQGERTEGDHTEGMVREQAFAVEGMWAGLVRTEPAMISGWHHHGDYDTSIYVVNGSLRMESGPGGSEIVEAGPGDFVHVPRGAIHREGNPGTWESHLVVVRAGHGPAVVNVDGPAAD